MLLNALPPDLLRPILAHLTIFEYVKLQQTFDRQIHRAFSFPGVFEEMRLPDPSLLATKPTLDFLKLVRNVTTLKIHPSFVWPINAITLLTALNPIELSFHYPFLPQSVIDKMFSELEDPSIPKEARLTRFLTPVIFPKLPKLTPRLSQLSLTHSTRYQSGDYYRLLKAEWTEPVNSTLFYRLPATLTRFTLTGAQKSETIAIINELPDHLLHLKLDSVDFNPDISAIASRFPLLETLIIALHRR